MSTPRELVFSMTAISDCRVRDPAAPTEAYWRRSSSSALADQGSSSQSNTSQSLSSSSHSSVVLMAALALCQERPSRYSSR